MGVAPVREPRVSVAPVGVFPQQLSHMGMIPA